MTLIALLLCLLGVSSACQVPSCQININNYRHSLDYYLRIHESEELLCRLGADLCRLDSQSAECVRSNKPRDILSLNTFSNLLISNMRREFLGNISSAVLLEELSAPSRSTESKLRIIDLALPIDDVIEKLHPINRPEAISIIDKLGSALLIMKQKSYEQLQLVLSKGFLYKHVEKFYETFEIRKYIISLVSGIQAGFRDEKISCFEARVLLSRAWDLVGDMRHQNVHKSVEVHQTYQMWLKLWGVVLDCVSPEELRNPHTRSSLIVESILENNQDDDFGEEVGSDLLMMVLKNAPFLGPADEAFDSVSHLWKYATLTHLDYMREFVKFSPSLKSPKTRRNMFTIPTSQVFVTKLSQIICSERPGVFCMPRVLSEEQKEVLKSSPGDIPVEKLPWHYKTSITDYVYSSQKPGLTAADKVSNLEGLVSGFGTLRLLGYLESPSDVMHVAPIIFHQITSKPELFSKIQTTAFFHGLVKKTTDHHGELPADFWAQLGVQTLEDAAGSISRSTSSSLRESFLSNAWTLEQASVISEVFNLSLEDRLSLARDPKRFGSWLKPEEIASTPFEEPFALIQMSKKGQSREFYRGVAERLEYIFSLRSSAISFTLNDIPEPILQSIPAEVLREFPMGAFFELETCRDAIGKISMLEDDQTIQRGRNQQLAELFLDDCSGSRKQVIDSKMLHQMGSLVCYLRPNDVLSIPTKDLQHSLHLFHECCLTENQSLAIRSNLERDQGVHKLNYFTESSFFCQIFDFDFTTSDIATTTGDRVKSKSKLTAAIYEFVNSGGIINEKRKCASLMTETQVRRYTKCHHNASRLVAGLEAPKNFAMTCETLQILGMGAQWIDKRQFREMPWTEIMKCLNYSQSDSMAHLRREQKMVLMESLARSGRLSDVSLVLLRNFIPTLAELFPSDKFPLRSSDLDSVALLTNQPLTETEVQWLRGSVHLPAAEDFLTQSESEVIASIMALGSAICYDNRLWSAIDLKRHLPAVAYAARHCPYESIMRLPISDRIDRVVAGKYAPARVQEMGVLAVFLLAPSASSRITTDSLRAIPTEALEKIPPELVNKQPTALLSELSIEQAYHMLDVGYSTIEKERRGSLERSQGPVIEFEDDLVLQLRNADEPIKDSWPDSFAVTESSRQYIRVVYIYSSSPFLTLSSYLLVLRTLI